MNKDGLVGPTADIDTCSDGGGGIAKTPPPLFLSKCVVKPTAEAVGRKSTLRDMNRDETLQVFASVDWN